MIKIKNPNVKEGVELKPNHYTFYSEFRTYTEVVQRFLQQHKQEKN